MIKYISNARVIRELKLVNKININNKTEYNYEKVFINSNLFEIDK